MGVFVTEIKVQTPKSALLYNYVKISCLPAGFWRKSSQRASKTAQGLQARALGPSGMIFSRIPRADMEFFPISAQERSRDVPDLQGAPRGGAVPLVQDPVHGSGRGRGGRQPHEEHPHGEARQVVLRAQDAAAQVGNLHEHTFLYEVA